ncbi:hypothetical protein O6H91_05G107300 [Diphasiastrum complanatum]|uniref:Uncharacterized protein n=1 Tax=Diphasiastrum complanatum TaxID=34168 RepID=A0ACC2DS32_DIPCM|nr:hypothetical protein O6H91_05G107300 [Diphasiastrum complanatum]
MGDVERGVWKEADQAHDNNGLHSQADDSKKTKLHETEIEASRAFGVAHELRSVHEVVMPTPKSTLHEFLDISKEMLFPDNPFRQFRNQSRRRKCLLGMQYALPILEWGPQYNFDFFKSDLISGITIASLAIPQGIAYAKLANLPPIIGLYSSFLPPLLYALFGSSRDLAIGPGSILSILVATLLRQDVNEETNPEAYVRLAFTATFFAGVFQASLGIFRIGFITDFISHAAVVGFITGAAIAVSLQQLRGVLGIVHFTNKADVISVMHAVWEHPEKWSWRTILISICFLTFLLVTKEISKRKTNLFWLAAIAPLVSVFLSTLFVFLTHAEKHNVSIVGSLKKGLNPVSANQLYLYGPYAMKAMKIGLISGMVALTEAIAVGRTFATLKDYQIDGNKEMIALGIVNLGSSCMSCYLTTGAVSRTAVNYHAGCKTAVSNIVMATIVMITLLALTPLFHYTPDVILATIILAAVLGLIDLKGIYFIWKVDKLDFLACMGACLGVIFISIPFGLLIAVGISIGKILLNVTRPHTAILGRISGTSIYQDIEHYSNASQIPGILLIRIDSAIYFSNSNYLKERILRWVDDEEQSIQERNGVPLQYVILDLTPVTSIDTTGLSDLTNVQTVLQRRSLQLALASPGIDVLDKLNKADFIPLFGQRWIFATVCQAVQVCSAIAKEMSLDQYNENSKPIPKNPMF